MKEKFVTTTGKSFEIAINAHVLTAEERSEMVNAIIDGVRMETLENRDDFRTTVVSVINKRMREIAVDYVVYSNDVLAVLCTGVVYDKVYVTNDNGTKVITINTACKRTTEKRNGESVTVTRPDYIQAVDVAKRINAINANLKKAGYKDNDGNSAKFVANGWIDGAMFDTLTVFANNISGRLTSADVRHIEKCGDSLKAFTETSVSKRLECVQYFYDIFNAHTGQSHKAIEFIVKALVKDRRLATFDSMHYIDSVPSEYTVLSVLISHYINTGVKVLEKSKAKSIAKIALTENN